MMAIYLNETELMKLQKLINVNFFFLAKIEVSCAEGKTF